VHCALAYLPPKKPPENMLHTAAYYNMVKELCKMN